MPESALKHCPFVCTTVYAQAPVTLPPELDFRKADIYSEGTRMSTELFSLKTMAGKKLPTILMAHGWRGVKASLRPDASGSRSASRWRKSRESTTARTSCETGLDRYPRGLA